MSEEKKRGGFVGGIVAELKKVTWLSWNEALRLTALVLAVSIAVGLVLGGLDYLLSEAVKKFFVGG